MDWYKDYRVALPRTKLNLSVIPALSRLQPVIIRELELCATVYTLEVGQFLYRQGDPARAFFIVCTGGVRLVEHTSDGQDVQLKIFGQGELLALLAISGEYPHPAGVQAMDKSLVAGISGAAARSLVARFPDLGLLLIDLLVEHVHHSHSRIRQFAAERVERRLARALLHYGDKFGSLRDGILSIDITLSQKDLAEFAGTTIETVNRTLKSWEQRDYIRRSRQHIDLLDRLALMAVAEDQLYMGQRF
jgi:CRP-like cAMP-binding protein